MSPFHRISAALAVAAVAVLATTTPASAHDQLVSSTPAAGEQLASAPENVSLTFSGDLIVLDASMTGALVMVVDESGEDWATGEVEVDGNVVTAQLEAGMPVAGYQVRWQVVSEDGHPISGVIPFTVGDAEPMATESTGSSASGGAPDAEDQIAGESSGVLRMLLIGAGGAAVAAAAYALYRFLRRPRAAISSPDPGEEENL